MLANLRPDFRGLERILGSGHALSVMRLRDGRHKPCLLIVAAEEPAESLDPSRLLRDEDQVSVLGIRIRHAELHVPESIDLEEFTGRVTADVNADRRWIKLSRYRDANHLYACANVLETLFNRHRHDDLLSEVKGELKQLREKDLNLQHSGSEPDVLPLNYP